MAVALQEKDVEYDVLSDGFDEHVMEDLDGGLEELASQEIDEEYYDQFLWDSMIYAKVCVDKFFEGKEMYGGGPVPQRLLRSPRYLSMVLNTDMIFGVPYAYTALAKAEHPATQRSSKLATVEKDVKLVISILNHCHTLGIPKEFACGLMLMYLEICEGVQIVD